MKAHDAQAGANPDKGFIVDGQPAMSRVSGVSACSGHGFDDTFGIGVAVAQGIVDGRSPGAGASR